MPHPLSIESEQVRALACGQVDQHASPGSQKSRTHLVEVGQRELHTPCQRSHRFGLEHVLERSRGTLFRAVECQVQPYERAQDLAPLAVMQESDATRRSRSARPLLEKLLPAQREFRAAHGQPLAPRALLQRQARLQRREKHTFRSMVGRLCGFEQESRQLVDALSSDPKVGRAQGQIGAAARRNQSLREGQRRIAECGHEHRLGALHASPFAFQLRQRHPQVELELSLLVRTQRAVQRRIRKLGQGLLDKAVVLGDQGQVTPIQQVCRLGERVSRALGGLTFEPVNARRQVQPAQPLVKLSPAAVQACPMSLPIGTQVGILLGTRFVLELLEARLHAVERGRRLQPTRLASQELGLQVTDRHLVSRAGRDFLERPGQGSQGVREQPGLDERHRACVVAPGDEFARQWPLFGRSSDDIRALHDLDQGGMGLLQLADVLGHRDTRNEERLPRFERSVFDPFHAPRQLRPEIRQLGQCGVACRGIAHAAVQGRSLLHLSAFLRPERPRPSVEENGKEEKGSPSQAGSCCGSPRHAQKLSLTRPNRPAFARAGERTG